MPGTYLANGKQQLDPELVGFVCRQSGRGTTRTRLTGNSNPSSFLVPVPNAYTYPVVAVVVDGGGGAAFVRRDRGNQRSEYASDAPVNTGFTYYVFDWTPTIPAHLVAASVRRIFDGAGRPVFCDMAFPMFMVDKLDVTKSRTTFAGRKLAVAQGSFGGSNGSDEPLCIRGGQIVIDDGNGCDSYRYRVQGTIFAGSVSSDGSTAQSGDILWDNAQINSASPPPTGWYVPGTIMVIDVTYIPVGEVFF